MDWGDYSHFEIKRDSIPAPARKSMDRELNWLGSANVRVRTENKSQTISLHREIVSAD